MQSRKKLYPYLFLLPSLAGITVFYFMPLLDVIRRSFMNAVASEFVGFNNYLSVWHNKAFLLAFKNTLLFLMVSVPLLLVISLGTALLIKNLKGYKGVFRSSLLLPMGIPAACSTLFFRIFFDQYGWFNQLLFLTDTDKNWLKGGSVFGVLVYCYIWKNTGYDMILWSAGLEGVDPALYEAAKVDGGTEYSIFRYITVPLLKPTTVTIVILSALNTFKVFREAYFLAGEYPDQHIFMLQHLFGNWYTQLDIQKMTAAAVSVAVSVLMFVCLPVFGTGWQRRRKSRRDQGKGT